MRIRIADLAPGVNYALRLRSNSGDAVSEWSRVFYVTAASDIIAPATPTGVSGSMTGTSFNLTWNTVTTSSDGTPAHDLDHYEVKVESTGTATTAVYLSNDTQFEFTLEKNRALFSSPRANIKMSVRAVDKVGNASAYSSVVDQTNAAPANPTGFSGASGVDTINLKWTAVTDADLMIYRVYSGTTAGSQTTLAWSGLATNATIQTVDYSTDRWYKVVAVDVFNTESTAGPVVGPIKPTSSFAVDTVPPAVPTGLTAALTTAADSTTSAQVSWTAVTDTDGDLAGYRIGYRPVGASDWSYADVDYTLTSTRIDRLTPYVNYEFRIRSYDWAANFSSWSSTFTTNTAATNTAPSATTGVGASAAFGTVIVSWNEATEVDVKFGAGMYDVQLDTSTAFNTGSLRTTRTSATVTSFSNVAAGTWYARVRAVDSLGLAGAWSSNATVTQSDTLATQADIDAVEATAESAIQTYVTEYSVNGSESVAPTTGWSTATPVRTPGTFIWVRTTVTRGDTTTSTTSPALLTGNTGAQGTPGTPAATIDLTATTQVLTSPSGGGATNPTTSTVTGTALNTTITAWTYSVDGAAFSATVPAGVSRTGNVVTITGSTMTARTIAVKMADANGISDTMTVAKTFDGAAGSAGGTGPAGADAYTVLLTNESQTFAAGTTNALAGSATSTVVAYKGNVQQTATVGTITGGATGITAAVTNNGTTAPLITFTVTTALTTANGTFTIPVTVGGITFNQVFSWSLSFTGAQGTTGNTGATGVGVTSITPYFNQTAAGAAAPATPSASPPPAPWVATEPDYVGGTDLWRTERIIYTNATFAYTTPSKVSAYTAAVTAITTANGKNKTIHSTSAASGTTGYVAGDTWFQYDGSNIVIGQWRFTGSAWQSETVGNQVIANLDAAKITTGTLDANRIGANSITTNKLLVSDFTNLIANPQFRNGQTGWAPTASFTVVTTTLPDGGTGPVAQITANGGVIDITTSGITVQPGEKYYGSAWVRKVSGTDTNGTIQWATTQNKTDATVDWPSFAAPNVSTMTDGVWVKISGIVTVASNGYQLTPRFSVRNDLADGVYQFANLEMRRVNGGELIVDGSITATEMATGTITAASGIIADAAIVNAKIANVSADKLIANSSFINDLNVKSKFTLGDAGTDGVIESYDYTTGGGNVGFRLAKSGLIIKTGQIEAAALKIQTGTNIVPSEYSNFEFVPTFYTGKVVTTGAATSNVVLTSGGKHGPQYLQSRSTATGAYLLHLGSATNDYNIVVEPSTSYIVSAWVKTGTVASSISFKAIFEDLSSSGLIATTALSASGAWQRISGVVNVPVGISKMILAIDVSTTTSGAGFDIDGIQIEQKIGSLTTPSTWTRPGVTSVDGGIIRTGEIRSNSTVLVNGVGQPAWSINMSGNAQFGDAAVRGKLVVGTNTMNNLTPNNGTFETGTATGYYVYDGTATGTGLTATNTVGEVISLTYSGKATATPVAPNELGVYFDVADIPPGATVRLSADVMGDAPGAHVRVGIGDLSTSTYQFIMEDVYRYMRANDATSFERTFTMPAGYTGKRIFIYLVNAQTSKFIVDNISAVVDSELSGSYLTSGNFQQGVQGWKIDSSGNAEFNNGTFRGILSASTMIGDNVVGGRIISGPVNGTHAEMTSAGFRAFIEDPVDGVPNEVVRIGTEGNDLFALSDSAGMIKASIADTGYTSVSGLNVDADPTIMGYPMVGSYGATIFDLTDMPSNYGRDYEVYPLGLMETYAKGTVAWWGGTASTELLTTSMTNGTQRALFELGFDMEPGRQYMINLSPILFSATSTGIVCLVATATFDGSIPLFSSPILSRHYTATSISTNVSVSMPARLVNGNVTSQSQIRVLWSLLMQGGAAGNVYGDQYITASIVDVGPVKQMTGTARPTYHNGGGTPSAPVKKTYTTTWNSTAGYTYRGDGVRRTDTSDIVQGYSAYATINGNGEGLWLFPSSIATTLAGSTVNKVEVYAYANHWYANSGGTASVKVHGYTSMPASNPSMTSATTSSNWPKPGGRWVTLPSSMNDGFRTGTYRGFGMGPGPSTSSLYYGRFNGGTGAKIRITYTK